MSLYSPLFRVSASVATLLALIATADATTISRDFDGNDCAGVLGDNFESCAISIDDVVLSPVIIKIDGGLSSSEINTSLFPSIDGSEFGFSDLSSENKTGTWTYTAGPDDPAIRYWVAKAGPGFTLFWDVDDGEALEGGACDPSADVYNLGCLSAAMIVAEGSWIAPDDKGLSHLTFYDTGAPMVPVPAAAWLFGSALGLLGWARRRQ